MVEFVVQVPEFTPHGHRVFLAGDSPVLGHWSADGYGLQPWGDGTHRAWINLPEHEPLRFLVTLGRWRTAESSADGRELPPRLMVGSRHVEARVAGWDRHAVHYHHDFPSRFLPHSRTLSVWIPPTYDLELQRHYPVLYLHDGQNLFDAETAFAGNPWWANEVAERVIRRGEVPPVILVGIANTSERLREYGPRRPGTTRPDDWARDYARFVVEEVKPFIDGTYRTLRGPEHTGVGGSSMGGLISLNLCKWYPGVFGLCAAMSPSLWWDGEYFLREIGNKPGWLTRCRIWLDMGNREGHTRATQRAGLRRTHRLADAMREVGAERAGRLRYVEVADGEHNERAWSSRFDQVLRWLYAGT